MKVLQRVLSVLCVVVLLVPSISSAEPNVNHIDTIKALLESLVEDYYYSKVECNESGFIIQIAHEGLSWGMLSVSAGLTDYEVWARCKESIIAFTNSTAELIKSCGIDEPNLLIVLLDDLTLETTYLAVYNGIVIYDYLPEQ